MSNPVIESMLNRKSIRKYREESPSEEMIESIVRTGQQAPFVSQLYSVLLSRTREKHPFAAPLLFTICVDFHKLELIMKLRGWNSVTNDLSMLLFGIQDASLMAQNMVIAAESLGLGSCFLGAAPHTADKIVKKYKLPKRVFPLVQLAVGYPAEDPPLRPRYPLDFVLFENEYPRFDDETITRAMRQMDEGYLSQSYYRRGKFMIPVEGDREENFSYENYGWTEHISRKWGQRHPSPQDLLDQLAGCGLYLTESGEERKK